MFQLIRHTYSYLNVLLHKGSVILFFFPNQCLCIYYNIIYYNTPIYRKILFQFLKFTEKCYINRMSFHLRNRAETVLKRAARSSKTSYTAYPSTPIESWKSSSTLQHSRTSKIGFSVSSSLLVQVLLVKLLPTMADHSSANSHFIYVDNKKFPDFTFSCFCIITHY